MSDETDDLPEGLETRRHRRWTGLFSLTVSRWWQRATGTTAGRIVSTVAAVALTIAFLLVVTGIALSLADGGVTTTDDATVHITPEAQQTLSSVDGVEGPRLGATNERASTIRAHDGVAHASPVLIEAGRLEAGGDPQTVQLVGVVPDGESRTVAGLPTDALEDGDPHYANGSYDGPRTGGIVLSRTAADRLGASASDDLTVSTSPRRATNFSVTAVSETDAGAPVALVHASELQSLSGAADGELADRMVIWGEPDAARSAAADAYPDASVAVTDTADPTALFDDGLAFATSVIALVVGVTICASFVATTMGMTVDEDRRTLAVLESVGVPARGRLAVIAISTGITTLVGSVVGVGLGAAGIAGVNAVASATVAPGAVAQFHPLFVPYGIAVAVLAGIVAVPYPLAVAARTSVLAEVGR
ncbi:FtsX-like permease family protein [Natrinema hispanicum]|uniref:Putative ABC transport system permease protein n=1 Tax=Natrinema hispanicum TaxID=392421 RepID=A0A1G6I9L1_9EURY|nr:FtsX-like permease family protein [Natrinema hispanicum]SDC03184.1 putative ABC transport system permease protein [Natrinema hispanicum]SES86905.1 putative ABC transport system permease protein [Natrinema hispanicum]